MTNEKHAEDVSNYRQLKRYADDFAKVYRSGKEKDRALKAANRQLAKFASDLNKTFSELKTAHQDLQEAYIDTIHRLVLAAEQRDEDTGDHIRRMSQYSAMIARGIGLHSDDVQNILFAAPMHDVGKIGIPDSILLEPGKLSDDEFELMKTHTEIGGEILENANAKVLKIAHEIALYHHEKWNGTGYPEGRSGEEIPLAARIVGLADVFDALTSRRPYKDPYPANIACEIIERESGKHFDPVLVDVFLAGIDQVLEIQQTETRDKDVCPSDFTCSQRDADDGTFIRS
jgi:putative two-component system response regulator